MNRLEKQRLSWRIKRFDVAFLKELPPSLPSRLPLEHTKHQLTLTWAWWLFPFMAVKWLVQTMLLEAMTAHPAAMQTSPAWYATGQRTQRIIFPAGHNTHALLWGNTDSCHSTTLLSYSGTKLTCYFSKKDGSAETFYTHTNPQPLCFQCLHICNNAELIKVFGEPYSQFKAL